jgi:hypothetical protein
MNDMKTRYRLTYRGSRQMFYCVDKTTGKRTSLKTLDRDCLKRSSALIEFYD